MEQRIKVKLTVVVVSFLVAVWLVIPSLQLPIPSILKPIFPKRTLRLGLDLKGGIHLVLGVDVEAAVKNLTDRMMSAAEEIIEEKKAEGKVYRTGTDEFAVEVTSPVAADVEAALLDRFAPQLIKRRMEMVEGKAVIYFGLHQGEINRIRKNTIDQAIETIRNRIDQFGVTEPVVQRQGEDHILIQLPGIADPERAKNIIGKTALLEFKIVDDESKFFEQFKDKLPEGVYLSYESVQKPDGSVVKVPYLWSRSESALKKIVKGKVPPDHVVLIGEMDRSRRGGTRSYRTYYLQAKTLLTGDYIQDARVRFTSQFNEPYVAIKFTSQGGRIFEDITARNVGRRLAIILDNRVYSAPRIKERIAGGSAIIEGSFTTEEAHDLALVLRSGALPAPVTVEEERTVGPSLGRDSIRQGLFSIVIGGVILFIFIVVYYRASGLLADFALFFNLVLVAAVMSLFEATLTLPGIAGLILTVGMAVDANVLIFERMREELDLGKTPRAVVESGFNRAFLTIVDANITTVLAAAILFQFGTGPIKGFAVTLTIGILASMYTAVFAVRAIYEYLVYVVRIERISI